MEFRKKYIFMIPFTLLFFYFFIGSLITINEFTVKEFVGNNFPFLLSIGFWVLEFIKYEEVNKDSTTSGDNKRLLSSDTALIPFLAVFAIYFIAPYISYSIDSALGLDQTFYLISTIFIIIPVCIYLTQQLLKIDLEYIKENLFKYISYILIFSVALFGLNIVLNIVYYIFDLQLSGANEESINTTLRTLPTFNKMLFIIYIIIGAPILEEFIFRGLILQPTVSKVRNYVIAIAVSLVFAFFHYVASFDPELLEFTDPISVFVPYFVMSMVFCSSYIESDYNLLVPIGIHALNNFTALALY